LNPFLKNLQNDTLPQTDDDEFDEQDVLGLAILQLRAMCKKSKYCPTDDAVCRTTELLAGVLAPILFQKLCCKVTWHVSLILLTTSNEMQGPAKAIKDRLPDLMNTLISAEVVQRVSSTAIWAATAPWTSEFF